MRRGGGPIGGVHHIDGFVGGAWFQLAPNYPAPLPAGAASVAASTLMLRMSIGGLANYLWSNPLCKKDECNGPWDSHLENFDRGLLGPILLNSSAGQVNLTHAPWKVCAGLHGEALDLSSGAVDPPSLCVALVTASVTRASAALHGADGRAGRAAGRR